MCALKRWPKPVTGWPLSVEQPYATYDLTNQATLRNWTTMLTVTDVLWGSTLAAFCSYCGYVAADRQLEASYIKRRRE